MEKTNRWALITGGSLVSQKNEGIGYHLARCFARGGWNLVLNARNEDDLRRAGDLLAGVYRVEVRTIARDLALPESPGLIFQELREEGIPIHTLVNNAGFTVYGPFAAADRQAMLDMLQVNMVALTAMTWLFLPPMLDAGSGGILNVASTAAFLPGPYMAIYYASKAYVVSFTRALAAELAGTGVGVTVLCPGNTRTRFWERAGTTQPLRMHRLSRPGDPARVAERGYQGWRAGRVMVFPNIMDRLVPVLGRVLPTGLLARVMRRLQEPVPG